MLCAPPVLAARMGGRKARRFSQECPGTPTRSSRRPDWRRGQRQYAYMSGGQVFLDPRTGTPWTDERAFGNTFWTPLLKLLGVRDRRPYNMRHTYATAMLMAGMTPAFCAKQLGHGVALFLSTYSKWIDGAQNDVEMQRLEVALSPGYPRTEKEK